MVFNISKLDPKRFKIKTYYLKEKEKSVYLFSLKIYTFCFQKDHPVLNYSFRKNMNHIHIFERGWERPQLLKIWFGDETLP